ncbi:MAG: hypothetical protein ACKV2T_15745 [Kofleriaceae bacterium]
MNRLIVVACLAGAACAADPALEPGDCPGTPTRVALDPVAPFHNGLVLVTFESGITPGYVEVQRYSPTRGVWEPTYGTLGERDDGTFVMQLRPMTSASDANSEFRVRVRARLDGCPASGWGESDPIMLADPTSGTTWVADLGPADFFSQISASSSGPGTTTGPYRIASSSLKHTLRFAVAGAFSETVDFTIQSATSTDVYHDCHFVLTYEGRWVADEDYSGRVAIYERRFMSLTGSTCVNPPLGDLRLTDSRLEDTVTFGSNIDYSRLLETPAGRPRWALSLISNAFGTILASLDDQTGQDTASLSGYLNVFDPRYEKQP